MNYQEFQPHPLLKPFVENYWKISTTGHGEGIQEELIVPDGNTSLMFVAEAISRFDSDNSKLELKGQTMVVGQKSKPVFYQFENNRPLQSFGIRFKAAGLSCFSFVPQAELADILVDGREIFGQTIREVHEQIVLAHSDGSRIDLINAFLLDHIQPLSWQQKLIENLILKIQQTNGQAPVADLAAAFNVHHRQLERLFNQYVGLSPKAYARVVRFNKTIVLHEKAPRCRLTDLAYAAGYFDQMHFIKEIKVFTRKTPSSFFREEAGFFQSRLKEILAKRLDARQTA